MEKKIAWVCGAILCWGGCLPHPDTRVPNAITLQNLSNEVRPPENEIEYFNDAVSYGRFPAGIAVARVHSNPLYDGSQASPGSMWLYPLKSHEATFWAELFDGTSEIREMVMVHERSVRDLSVTIPELQKTASIMQGGLLLVYGYDNISNRQACTVSGLLYEVSTGNLLAVIRKQVTLQEAQEAARELGRYFRPKKDRDLYFYMDYLAFRGFEENFRECMWHYVDRDEPAQSLEPNPFENPKPSYPRRWRPPRG